MPTQTTQDTPALTYLTTTLSSLLTTTINTYTAYILPLLPSPLQSISLTLSSILAPIVSTTSSDGTKSIDVVSLASMLLILYLSLRILDFVRRSIMSWVRFFIKMGLLLLVIQAGFYVQAYGWEKAVRDAGWVGGLAWGWAEEMLNGMGGQGTNEYPYGAAGRGSGGGKGWMNTSGREQTKYGGGGTRRRGAWS